jgi:hypothetical protein
MVSTIDTLRQQMLTASDNDRLAAERSIQLLFSSTPAAPSLPVSGCPSTDWLSKGRENPLRFPSRGLSHMPNNGQSLILSRLCTLPAVLSHHGSAIPQFPRDIRVRGAYATTLPVVLSHRGSAIPQPPLAIFACLVLMPQLSRLCYHTVDLPYCSRLAIFACLDAAPSALAQHHSSLLSCCGLCLPSLFL